MTPELNRFIRDLYAVPEDHAVKTLTAFVRLVRKEALQFCNHPVVEPRPCEHCRDTAFNELVKRFGLEGK